MTERVGGRAPSPSSRPLPDPGAACTALSVRFGGVVVALVAVDLEAETVTPRAVHDPEPSGQSALELLLGLPVPLKGTICATVCATRAPAGVGRGGSLPDDALPDGWLHYSVQHGIESALALPVAADGPIDQVLVVARRDPEPFVPDDVAALQVAAQDLAATAVPDPAVSTTPDADRPGAVTAASAAARPPVPFGVDVALGALAPTLSAVILGGAANPNSYRPTSVLVLAVAALGLLRGRVAAASCAITSFFVIWWAFTAPYRTFHVEDGRSAWGLLVLGVAMGAMWLLVDRVERTRQRSAEAAGLSDALIDEMPVGFALVGPDRRLRRINQRFADLAEVGREDPVGRLPSVVHPATGARSEALVERVLAEGTPILDTVLESDRPEAGIEHTWRMNHFPVRSGDEVVAVGLTMEDISEDLIIRRRAQLLLRMSRRVAGATTSAEIADAVTETLAEGLRARCLFAQVDDGVARIVASSGYHDPDVADRWHRLEVDTAEPGTLATSLRASELVLRHVGDEDDAEAERRRAAGDVTVAWQPVVGPGAASATAAIGIAWPFDRHLTEHSRTLLQTAASVAGLALARVELTERTARDRFRGAMDAMLDQVVMARSIRDESGRIVDFEVDFANRASLVRPDGSLRSVIGGRVRELYPAFVRSGLYDRFCEVVESGVPWEVDRLAYADTTPTGDPVEAWWSLQVMKVDDGYLAASRDVTELVLADQMAAEAREALQREHLAVDLLQRAALPTVLPQLHGLDVGAHYRPARLRQPVGGDWYDAFPLEGDELAFVVADVAGHGQEAAAYMVQVRNIFRAVAIEHHEPDEVLAGVDRVLQRLNEPGAPFVTCCYATLDTATGRLRWALAGHPPPVVSRADGSSLVGHVAPGPPLATIPGGRYEIGEVRLGAGDLVVLYTDGLVERRGEVIDVGIDRLVAQVRERVDVGCDATAAHLADLVPDPTDDIAILCVSPAAP